MRKLLFYISAFILIGLPLLIFIFIEIMTLLDYKPAPQTVLVKTRTELVTADTFTILSWNIGYAGLSADMDFFYEGGYNMRPAKAQCAANLSAICNVLKQNDSMSFMLIQEIDQKAHRSYGANQVKTVGEVFQNQALYFAKDFDVEFIPLPLTNPTGRVVSGIATSSAFYPAECTQYAYPAQSKWPQRVFMMDNCFLLSRFDLKNGKDLVVINTHNSAYDDGSKRQIEMDYLRGLMLEEYGKGNYVIAGGDWNQRPPLPDSALRYTPSGNKKDYKYFNPLPIAADFMPPQWQWVSDGQATNRFLYEPYQAGHTAVTLIDFFLISPNIECIGRKTIDLGFAHSDHNPITARFVLH